MLTLVYILILGCVVVNKSSGQASQWIDGFQKTLCHDRWAQMDWQSIIRPCHYNMEFGKNKNDDKQRTSPKWSHTLGLHFKRTGEFSRVGIQSRTEDGHNKMIGGDTWRVFIRGSDNIVPFVSDLNNGVYEAKFVAMNPGFYKAEIVLQSTLCEAFKDPPQDWLKRNANTIISDEKNSRLQWTSLRGGNISFKIEDSSKETKDDLRRSFSRWRDSCGAQYSCNLLWKGFGRWSNTSWIPYVDEEYSDGKFDSRCLQKNGGGILKMTGDSLTKDLFRSIKNTSICNGGLFRACEGVKSGEQPVSKMLEKRKVDSKRFKTSPYLRSLKKLLKRKEMDENSALIITYGHPFVENLSFKKYRTFIDRAVRILSEKYHGKAIWRTMSSNWRDATDPVKHFGNHQRIQLFNAYATSAMCNAGIPVLDVFQMTESVPESNRHFAIKTISGILEDFLRKEKGKNCDLEAYVASTGLNASATTLDETKNSTSAVNLTSTFGNKTQVSSNPTAIYTKYYGGSTTANTLTGYASTSGSLRSYDGSNKQINIASQPSFSANPYLYQSKRQSNYERTENAQFYKSTARKYDAIENIPYQENLSIQKTRASSRDNLIESFVEKSKRQEIVS